MVKSVKEEKAAFTSMLGNPAKVKVLDFLMSKPDADYSISQIAEGAGIGRTTLFRIFESLEKLNLVRRTRVIGNAKLYTLNIANPIVEKMFDLYTSIYSGIHGEQTEKNSKQQQKQQQNGGMQRIPADKLSKRQ